MSIRVAAVDPLPIATQGLTATLAEDGHRVESPEDVLGWARHGARPAILLTLAETRDWTLLIQLLDLRPDAVVVALLAEPDVTSYARAVAAGALGVVPRASTPAVIREAFRAALQEHLLLPAGMVRALVNPPDRHSSSRDVPTERELGWLRRLRQGVTVAQLAIEVGYSERMMFRLLAAVYQKLRVANRTEAIVYAHEKGWI